MKCCYDISKKLKKHTFQPFFKNLKWVGKDHILADFSWPHIDFFAKLSSVIPTHILLYKILLNQNFQRGFLQWEKWVVLFHVVRSYHLWPENLHIFSTNPTIYNMTEQRRTYKSTMFPPLQPIICNITAKKDYLHYNIFFCKISV